MGKSLIQTKKNLLRVMTEKRYFDLLRFVGEIYLDPAKLKVFASGQCAALYRALLPLALAENGGLTDYLYKEEFHRKPEPRVIAASALGAYGADIRAGKYRDILVIDYVIRDGQENKGCYDKLSSWMGKRGKKHLHALAYAKYPHAGLVEDPPKVRVMQECSKDGFLSLSFLPPSILQAAGEPIAPYMPHALVEEESALGQAITAYLGQADAVFPSEEGGEEAYIAVPAEGFPAVYGCSVRIRRLQGMGLFLFAPLAIPKPAPIGSIRESVSRLYAALRGKEMPEEVSEDVLWLEYIYLLSAFLGWHFTEHSLHMPPEELAYEASAETMDFGLPILPVHSQKKEGKIAEVLRMANGMPEPAEYSSGAEGMKKSHEGVGGQETLPALSRYLLMEEEKKNPGLPVGEIAGMGAGEEWACALHFLLDSGQGKLACEKAGNGMMTLMLHAGRQYRKYEVDTYFSFLYSLYVLEGEAEERGEEGKLQKWKAEFAHRYIEAFDVPFQEDMGEIKDKNITESYKEVLVEEVWDHVSSPELEKALRIALSVAK